MPEYSVWMEGYCVSGNNAEARLLGVVEAPTFKDACNTLCSEQAFQEKWGNYDSHAGAVWGCRLFDNEADARKVFG